MSVLKAQGVIPEDHTLFRDSSPRRDFPLRNDEEIDLVEGNVFYSRKGCFEVPATICARTPKLAFFVDDRHEETLNPQQTGKTLRELFGLADDLCLLRDLDSPNDDPIEPDESVEFAEGNVFITRCAPDQLGEVKIIVNTRRKTIMQKTLSYEEVVGLAFDNPPTGSNICITVIYRRGPACKPQGTMVQGSDPLEIQNGMIFDVTATDKS